MLTISKTQNNLFLFIFLNPHIINVDGSNREICLNIWLLKDWKSAYPLTSIVGQDTQVIKRCTVSLTNVDIMHGR